MARLNTCGSSKANLSKSQLLSDVGLGRSNLRKMKEAATHPHPLTAQPRTSSKAATTVADETLAIQTIERKPPLRLAHVDSLLFPMASRPLLSSRDRVTPSRAVYDDFNGFETKMLKQTMQHTASTAFSTLLSPVDPSFDDLSDFIVNDSATEEELQRLPRSHRKKFQQPVARAHKKTQILDSDEESVHFKLKDQTFLVDLTTPVKKSLDTLDTKNKVEKSISTGEEESNQLYLATGNPFTDLEW